MDKEIVIKKSKQYNIQQLIFLIRFHWYCFIQYLKLLTIGIIMFIKQEKRVYYDYTYRRQFEINGFEYLKQVRADLGEQAFFRRHDEHVSYCERF